MSKQYDQTDCTVLMAQMLKELRVEMNGAVVGAMEERGLNYPLNYGVSVPTLKQVAAHYAPNHKLARLLYRQQIRELQLSAIYVADPIEITESELDFWAAGVVNIEIAQHLGTMLLSRSQIVPVILDRWLNSLNNNELLCCSALLCAAKSVERSVEHSVERVQPEWSCQTVLGLIPDLLLGSCNRAVWHAVATLMERLWRFVESSHAPICDLVVYFKQHPSVATTFVVDEIGWLTDTSNLNAST